MEFHQWSLGEQKFNHVEKVYKRILERIKDKDKKIFEESLKSQSLGYREMFPTWLKNAISIPDLNPDDNVTVNKLKALKDIAMEVKVIELISVEGRPCRDHYQPTQINIEVEDDNKVSHYPFFDEDDGDLIKNLIDSRGGRKAVHKPVSQNLSPAVIVELIEKLKAERRQVISSDSSSGYDSSESSNDSVPQSKMPNFQKDSKSKHSHSSQPSFPVLTDEEIFQHVSRLLKPKDSSFKAEKVAKIYKNHASLKNVEVSQLNIEKALGKVCTADQMLETFTMLFCPMCNIFDCLQHRIYDVRKKRAKNLRRPAEPCANGCFLNLQIGIESSKVPQKVVELTNQEKTLLNVYFDTYQDNYCAITTLMKRELTITCSDIYLYHQQVFMNTGRTTPTANSSEENKKSKRSKQKRKEKLRTISIADYQHLYVPCNHPGKSCDKNCSCKANGIQCEKFCICGDDCKRQFRGCNCATSCQTNRCPCFLALRECDPDRCGRHSHDLTCKNNAIQKGLHKHLLMGVSQVAGWGVFLKGTAEKEDLISEYCGELISHPEAESRGLVYDKRGTSFMFEIIKDKKTCDSNNIGNKIRFANHDPENPNCYPKIVGVNGSLHIGIYAKRRIFDGEELFFDYGSVKFTPADTVRRSDTVQE